MNCGDHEEDMCSECPTRNGSSGCSGDCNWVEEHKLCLSKGIYILQSNDLDSQIAPLLTKYIFRKSHISNDSVVN